jgi:hypothetical protein
MVSAHAVAADKRRKSRERAMMARIRVSELLTRFSMR